MARTRTRRMLIGVAIGWAALGCSKEKAPGDAGLAPVASALEPAAPSNAGALALQVDEGASNLTFVMDSPLEKIHGEAPRSVHGELFVDPTNLTKSTGLVKADLQRLTLYQQKRADEKGQYGERKKSDLQNEHARDWLELNVKDGEVTAERAEMNRWAELKIDQLDDVSERDVTKLSGPERKVTATARGDFRLHGRKAKKSAKVELLFKYAGDRLQAIEVRTLEPLMVTLEEFEVHPRDAAGKLVKKLSDALSSNLKGKVAADAPVMVRFVAKPK